MATLGNLYGVNVEHYLRINFAGFINIIDAIGGVDVYSDQAFTSVGSPGYYDPTTFAEGWNHCLLYTSFTVSLFIGLIPFCVVHSSVSCI